MKPFRRWKEACQSHDIGDPVQVQELFELAVQLRFISRHDRSKVFAMAVVDRRSSRIRGALFRERVATARWSFNAGDAGQALKLIESIDGPSVDIAERRVS